MSTDYTPNMMGLTNIDEAMKRQQEVPGFDAEVKNLADQIKTIKDEEALSNLNEASNNMNELKKAQKDYIDAHKTEISDDDMTVFPKPSDGCGHCYGRGNEGWDFQTKEVRMCRCITNRFGRTDVEFMTVGELRSVLGYAKKLFNMEDKDEVLNKDVQGTDQEAVKEGIGK